MFFNKRDLERDPIRKKNLKDYSNEELKQYLNKNNELSLEFLTGICSEVLRRFVCGNSVNEDD